METKNKTADLFCYGTIGEEVTPEKVLAELQAMPKDTEEIIVHINSYGGDVFAGFNIHEQLVNTGKKITTIAEGICASIATVIFMSGSTRKITENTQMMFHAPSVGIYGESLTAKEILQHGHDLQLIENMMKNFYVKNIGMPEDEVLLMLSKDTWYNAEQAVKLNIATEKTTALKAVAYLKNNEMEFAKKIKASVDAVKKIFGEATTPNVVASSAKVKDGSEIYFDGTLASGVNVFSDSAMTVPYPDGDITMEDGKVVTIASGAVTHIEDQSIPDAAALKAENEALKKQLQDAALAKAESEKVALEAVTEMQARFEKIVSSGYTPKDSETSFRKIETIVPKTKEQFLKEANDIVNKVNGKK